MKTLIDWLNEGYSLFKSHMAGKGVDIEGNYPYQNSVAVICEDGFRVSIQASASHYCSPRRNFDRLERKEKQYYNGPAAFHTVPAKDIVIADYGIYSEFELGFPSGSDDLITPYAEDSSNLTGTVYGWVPVEIVESLIEKHGGVIGFDTKVLK